MTPKAEEPVYNPTAGAKTLLEQLGRYTGESSYDSLQSFAKDIKIAEERLVDAEVKLKSSQENLDKVRQSLAKKRFDISQIVIDLTKLSCPEFAIKRYFKEYNYHDVAEWIQYKK